MRRVYSDGVTLRKGYLPDLEFWAINFLLWGKSWNVSEPGDLSLR
jgi:hypothetical protein